METGEHTEQPQQNQPQTSTPVATPKLKPITDIPNQQDNTTTREEEAKNKKEPSWKFRVAVASVLVNIILAIGTYLLYFEAANQSKATKQNVIIADSSMVMDNRPYLTTEIVIDTTKFHVTPIIAKLENTGKTFAFARAFCEMDTSIDNFENRINGIESKLRDTSQEGISKLVIGRGIIEVYPLSKFEWNRENMLQLISGRLTFYVYGLIIYRDLFGREHKTLFCQYSNAKIEKGRFVYYKKYNEAD